MQKITIKKLKEICKSGEYNVKVKSPDGMVPISRFLVTDRKRGVLVNGSLRVSSDHPIQANEGNSFKPAFALTEEDILFTEIEPTPFESIKDLGLSQMYDIEVDHPNHRFYGDGYVVKNCESLKDSKHITRGPVETGDKYFHLITDVQKDMNTNQKFLIEIDIDSGPPAAMKHDWLRYVLTRAVLKASNGEFVKSLLAEKSNTNTRQGYRIKSDNFKSILGGIYLHEFQMNSGFNISQQYLDDMMVRINDFSTKGWNITNLKMVPADFILKNNLDWSWIEYSFDSRKVNNITLDFLQKKVDAFNQGNLDIKYKKQVAAGRDIVRTIVEDFDNAKILAMTCGVGKTKYETILKMFARNEEAHPLIVLAGLLGDKAPKAYTSLYGTDIKIKGFYKQPATEANVFNTSGTSDQSTTCPRCGHGKFINLMTSQPFGAHFYEQDPMINEKYGSVCQFCFMALQ